jgi:hypothetical protein
VVANLIADNDAAESPAQAEGAFGIGVGIAGGKDNTFRANRIANNPGGGVVLHNTEDLPAIGNSFADIFDGNTHDVINESAARAPAQGNCFETTQALTALPAPSAGGGWLVEPGCTQGSQPAVAPPVVEAPPGMSFLKVPAPRSQPGIEHVTSLPDRVPNSPKLADLSAVEAPSLDYLSDRTGTRH